MTRLSTLLQRALLSTLLATMAGSALAASYAPAQNPVGEDGWWWQPQWWQEGRIDEPQNYQVEVHWTEYANGDVEVPAMIARPKAPGRYPAVLFQHGRRGLDELLQLQVKRIAARGFDFRPPSVRTFADDLAAKDALMRAAAFVREHLAPYGKPSADDAAR